MASERYTVGKAPNLAVTCHGDLRIRGWAEPEVQMSGDSFQATETEDGLSVTSASDLNLMVPAAATLQLDAVSGDLMLKNVDGQIRLTEVAGDVALHNAGEVSVKAVRGDLMGRNLDGAFQAGEIMGDLSLRRTSTIQVTTVYGDFAASFVAGTLKLERGMGDISLKTVSQDVSVVEGYRDFNGRNLGGLTTVSCVRGDIRLLGGLAAGKHSFAASGDIVVRWPADAPLNVDASAPQISNHLPFDELTESEGHFVGSMGDGETFVTLDASGRIVLKESHAHAEPWDDSDAIDYHLDIDLGGLGERIASEVSSRVAEVSSNLERKFGPEFAAKIEAKAQKAAAKAERAAEKAARQAAKAASKARWQSSRSTWKPPRPEEARREPKATQAEQMKILKMVEQGVITPDEANTLLEALES